MNRKTPLLAPALFALALLLLSCDGRTVPTAPLLEVCGPYAAPESSPYLLPFPVGESSLIAQGNCGPYTHAGSIRYAYDFSLAIGRPIVAVRDGVVEDLEERFRDGEDDAINAANFVRVLHDDGSVASYVHLRQDGVLVGLGATVSAGEVIAVAGMTGFTGSNPHLHFEVFACAEGCDTIPVTFRNASPAAPDGLQMGVTYTALSPVSRQQKSDSLGLLSQASED